MISSVKMPLKKEWGVTVAVFTITLTYLNHSLMGLLVVRNSVSLSLSLSQMVDRNTQLDGG